MKGRTVLYIEDDPDLASMLPMYLRAKGYRVLVAMNGTDGLRFAQAETPDLILLDVMLPDIDGHEVFRRLKDNPATRDALVMFLTQKGTRDDVIAGLEIGADDYVSKPFNIEELELRMRAVLRRLSPPPFVETADTSVLTMTCEPGERIHVRAEGPRRFRTTTRNPLTLDPVEFSNQAAELGSADSWRLHAKEIGRQIFQCLFEDHPRVLGSYNRLLGMGHNHDLHLSFESGRDFLRVPVEFLLEGVGTSGEYLALKHPLTRYVRGIYSAHSPLSGQFMNEIWRRKETFRILLVASDTTPPLPGADAEVTELTGTLKRLLADINVTTALTVLHSEETTYDRLVAELKSGYHLIHYAGHGCYDTQMPEESSLLVWAQPNRGGPVKRLTVSEIAILLQNSPTRLVYLSCCEGAATASEKRLDEDDLLGLADGIIQAGVPAVLSFRWPVSDHGSQQFALSFYESFFRNGSLGRAALDARRDAAAESRSDRTWLSPVLILQD
jgi:DNA-binding response OmpR family regulator